MKDNDNDDDGDDNDSAKKEAADETKYADKYDKLDLSVRVDAHTKRSVLGICTAHQECCPIFEAPLLEFGREIRIY